ncbi:MAG TPA: SRPBCC domain-containing protein [Acidimicrobiales bacterium]
MADIRHRFGTTASPAAVYAAVGTIDGLAGWWTSDTRGDASPGGKLEFYFGRPDPSATMEVLESVPDERVVWRCMEGPDTWMGTTFTFAISPEDGQTILMFTNEGWREPVPFMHHCSTKWAYFLLGLKATLAGGPSVAFPNDAPLDNWG